MHNVSPITMYMYIYYIIIYVAVYIPSKSPNIDSSSLSTSLQDVYNVYRCQAPLDSNPLKNSLTDGGCAHLKQARQLHARR